SDKSRNFSFGQSLGQRSDAVQTATVEGRSTAIAVAALAENQGIDMPLTRVVAALVEQKLSVSEAVKLLMSRPLKAE
ncbi:MAG: glycerol-3-phosphate dehydrogenase, partial [Paracoccaceae bacterium]|nr:glycerol-3-phosphate dehydrogenase [Paracoccaceae bacterium]